MTPDTPITRRALLVGAGCVTLVGCSKPPGDDPGINTTRATNQPPSAELSPVPEPVVSISVEHGTDQMWPHEPIQITVENGQVVKAVVTDDAGTEFNGVMKGDLFAPSHHLSVRTSYTLSVITKDGNGKEFTSNFPLTTVSPELVAEVSCRFAGEDIGNGMPIWINFDLPVNEDQRADIEKRCRVTTTPVQEGAFGWVDENTLQWRPKDYWQAGSTATVEVRAAGCPAGDTWVLADVTADYHFGDLRRLVANIDAHTLECYRNGALEMTLPVSMGKPGYETMTGTKLIMSKEYSTRMTSQSYGVPKESAEGYDITAYYAQRITWSGEYFHAAPWADGSHGYANVSHGCTGMSMSDAEVLFNFTMVGDPAEFIGSTFACQPYQTWGCWLYSFADWKELSAL